MPATLPTPALVRLDAHPQVSRLRVDSSYPGRISGLSVLTTGPALGHGFEIDHTTVSQVAAGLNGKRGRWTHGGLSEDGLARHLGSWSNASVESFRLCRDCNLDMPARPASLQQGAMPMEPADPMDPMEPTGEDLCPTCGQPMEHASRVVADFSFSASAHKIKPDGLDVPAPAYLMQRAAEDPQSLGVSIVAALKQHEQTLVDENGTPVGTRYLARLAAPKDLRRADWVADPAANPVGLHAGTDVPSELTEGATKQLTALAKRVGPAEARRRADAFLTRLLGEAHVSSDLTDEIEARLARLEAENADLKTALTAHKDAEAKRHEQEIAANVAALQAKCTSAGCPIEQAKLDRYEAALKRGDTETAQDLADAYMARSQALGAGKPAGVSVSLGSPNTSATPDETAAKRERTQFQAEALKRRGWDVALSDDGTEFTRKTPPQPRPAGRRS